jgi:hypothetical protein
VGWISQGALQNEVMGIAVGIPITGHPPHRSRREYDARD